MFLQFKMPWSTIILYFIAAVLPAAVLMYYVYRKDRVEKEPAPLLRKLLLGGVLAALAAMALEMGSENLLVSYAENTGMSQSGYSLATAVSVGIIEELTKFFFLYKFSWNNKAFNYTFDGLVYAVFVSLGFAAFENILYIFFYGGIDVAVPRALLAIPAHMSFSVYMGLMYGMAKVQESMGNIGFSNLLLTAGFVLAAVLHSVYDGSIMIGTPASVMFFYGFVVVLDLLVILTIKTAAKKDQRIY
ncbi:MAG: PrsW family intramembrane metalloprotease [Solobacterium sp.]|nr:PrsW family intramembrane metalloprotease [Solobacterium sp.]